MKTTQIALLGLAAGLLTPYLDASSHNKIPPRVALVNKMLQNNPPLLQKAKILRMAADFRIIGTALQNSCHEERMKLFREQARAQNFFLQAHPKEFKILEDARCYGNKGTITQLLARVIHPNSFDPVCIARALKCKAEHDRKVEALAVQLEAQDRRTKAPHAAQRPEKATRPDYRAEVYGIDTELLTTKEMGDYH